MEFTRVRHVDEVRQILGSIVLDVLNTIFDQSRGLPPATKATRFRADHADWLELIDTIDSGLLLKWDQEKDSYRVSGYALPLLKSRHSIAILECLETAYQNSKVYYRENLRNPLKVKDLLEMTRVDASTAREALHYMRDVDGWWSGIGIGFPMVDDETVIINEQVLRFESFGDLIARVYEWHFINPKERAAHWPPQYDEHKKSSDLEGFFVADDIAERPGWFSALDDTKKALIGELDIALRHNLLALPTIGIRTLLEQVMAEHVNKHVGFSEMLKQFIDNGFVTSQHGDSLRKVLDVGHASVHRAHFPNKDDVRTCVDVVKHLMHGLYVLDPKVKKMSENTPPRKSKEG